MQSFAHATQDTNRTDAYRGSTVGRKSCKVQLVMSTLEKHSLHVHIYDIYIYAHMICAFACLRSNPKSEIFEPPLVP